MSKLDDLINELCPNGVKYEKIKNCFNRLKGTPITAGKMKEIETENGEIRIFAGGKTVINAKEEQIPNANIVRVPAVLVQSRGVIDVVYFESPFTFKNEMWAYTHREKTTVKYLYYVLKNNIQQFRDSASGMGSLPQISLPVTEEFQIPLPPLPVQEEIVRILDNFTELTAELTAELAARKKQYEYYKDSLLTFGDKVPMVFIPNIAKTFIGLVTTMTKHYVPVGVPLIHNSSIQQNRFVFQKRTYLDEIFAVKNQSRRHEIGDVITVHTGDVGTSAIINEELDGSLGFATIVSRIKDCGTIMPKFLCHFLNSHICKRQIVSMIKGDRDNLNLKDFNRIKVPVPPLPEQQRIVDILDRFDTLCNDISSGLPAEIKARQQQYEYYRDKLLTFPKAELEV